MINEVALREGLKKLLKQTEDDIRQRLKDESELEETLKAQHAVAAAAGRTAAGAFTAFRDDAVTQASVHWLLACVFVRFLEDNRLIDEAWIAGPDDRLTEAQDRRSLFYRENPRANDSDYLLQIFTQVSKLPDMADLFHREHNPLWRLGPTGPQAMNILRFFQQRTEATGGLLHDFTDPAWGTRFLGDLYQNLSDFARKRYALCQTPAFVVPFLLDRTLSPAIDVFGVDALKLLDPACGSGHFLIAAFERLYRLRLDSDPGECAPIRAQKALDAISGVDLNPFAVATARFRLLIAALLTCGIQQLRNAPVFRLNLAVGDSLIHGPRLGIEGGIQRGLLEDPVAHYFETEDGPALHRILGEEYHVVVGNPPYINVPDRALRETYRQRFGSCRGRFNLGVPFVERFFNLALRGDSQRGRSGGFVGLIVSNAFMKRSTGKRLIEAYIPNWDLTHIVDTSGAHFPAHGTPTVILLGRHQRPTAAHLRAVRGIRGEVGIPEDPANAPVWRAIVTQVDRPGSESRWVSVDDVSRDAFGRHPWSIGGGGVSDLKDLLDEERDSVLRDHVTSIGKASWPGQYEIFAMNRAALWRKGVPAEYMRPLVGGEAIREWFVLPKDWAVTPYSLVDQELVKFGPETHWLRSFWPFRHLAESVVGFGGKTRKESGEYWFGWYRWIAWKYRLPKSITFAEVATHGHFAPVEGVVSFDQTSPVIKLSEDASVVDQLALAGLLNSSTACFWLKQVCYNKGTGGISEGLKTEKWEQFLAFNATTLEQLPIPVDQPRVLANALLDEVHSRCSLLPESLIAKSLTLSMLRSAEVSAEAHLRMAISIQEELDWQVYHLYGLLDDDLSLSPTDIPPLKLGQRPFEILMARQMEAGELETSWFDRHGSTPITEIPAEWPERYRCAVERRLEIIQTNRDIALIEQPEYKRRWNLPSWEEMERKALESWLLDRMERAENWRELAFKTCARMADSLRRDAEFVQVAELYQGRPDFDMTELVTTLVKKQGVPFLPMLRYKPSGIEKRREWEAVWDLQRREDAGEKVEIPVPPKYKAADFLESTFWNLRGGLDVPKERFILYPHLERDADSTPVLAWAGWDHLQQAQALAAYYHHVKEEEGWTAERLKPALAGLLELMPWLKQWHNEVDPATGERMGDTFGAFVEAECQEFGFTASSLRDWTPPQTAGRRGRRRNSR